MVSEGCVYGTTTVVSTVFSDINMEMEQRTLGINFNFIFIVMVLDTENKAGGSKETAA